MVIEYIDINISMLEDFGVGKWGTIIVVPRIAVKMIRRIMMIDTIVRKGFIYCCCTFYIVMSVSLSVVYTLLRTFVYFDMKF